MQESELEQLVINRLTRAQYDAIESKDPHQLYFITDDNIFVLNSQVVTSISSSSTDSQIPSAKCIYDELHNKSQVIIRRYE